MGFNRQVGTVDVPATSGGTAVINLPDGFDPKALIVQQNEQTADGAVQSSAVMSIGVATNDGGAIQQGFTHFCDMDNQTTVVTAHGVNTNRCVYNAWNNGGALNLNFDAHVAAAGDWTDTQITLTFPTVAAGKGGIKIAYLVLGGSDIESAKVGSFALSTGLAANGTQDVTVGFSGGGQPDLLMFLPSHLTALGQVVNSDYTFGVGWAKSDTDRYCSIIKQDAGNTASNMASVQKARAFCTFLDILPSTGLDAEIDLAARAAWPANGVRLVHADPAGRAAQIVYLALKGTFTSTLVNASTLTTGSTQDHAHGSAPAAFLSATTLVPPTDAVDTTSTQLGGMSLGLSDLTNEVSIACGSDDGQGTMWVWSAMRTTKALYTLDQPVGSATTAPVERAQADATASGTDLRLTYTTLDSVAREYIGLVLGGASQVIVSKPVNARQAVQRAAVW